MKKILILIIGAFLLPILNAQAQEQQFFSSLYDVPIMSGLEEVAELSINYDKPAGRISQAGALATQGMAKEDILTFYKAALTQFGWVAQSGTFYIREDESLKLSFEDKNEQILVHFMISPNSSKSP